MSDKFKDKCGVFGVYDHPDAVAMTVRGLHALQHRGQESAGVAYSSTGEIRVTKVMGTVTDLAPRVRGISARSAIGHVRYGTCGRSSIEQAQPFVCPAAHRQVALCHNGHIVDIEGLRARLPAQDSLTGISDSELLARRVAMHFKGDIASAAHEAFQDVTPAYSVLVLTSESLCAIRDPLGMRPLSLGRKDGATLVSSESCAFDTVGATYLRDVEPGEIVVVRRDGFQSIPSTARSATPAHCIFELIYFARPDSVMFGHSVADFRIRLGARLAREAPVPADIVVPAPDSAVFGGVGYARESGIELALALFRNNLVGRSFIEPTPEARIAAVRAKVNPIRGLLKGQRVILVDDSIVRGTTCRHLVRILRDAGVRAVHLRVTSPPTIASCHFGIDTPHESQLFANGRSRSDMRDALGVDSLEFLSLEGLFATAGSAKGFCAGCFSGHYPGEARVASWTTHSRSAS
jgi:amidophosphoribosyltransferase